MRLPQSVLHELADKLHHAEVTKAPLEPLTSMYPELDEECAYCIQTANAGRALREGKRLVGYKVGLTSREAQRQFSVFQPDYGHLFDTMAVAEESTIDLGELIQPKIEAEIAFVLGRDLKGPGVTAAEAAAAVDCVVAALEIVDSRIRDWKIKAADTIADNGSSARFVLSSRRQSLTGLDLPTIGVALSQNGEVRVTGAGAAVMGNPLNALVFLANELGRQDKVLLAGEVVLSGAVSAMLPAKAGDSFACEMLGLGRLGVRFTGRKE